MVSAGLTSMAEMWMALDKGLPADSKWPRYRHLTEASSVLETVLSGFVDPDGSPLQPAVARVADRRPRSAYRLPNPGHQGRPVSAM